jgi:hypothetical protein
MVWYERAGFFAMVAFVLLLGSMATARPRKMQRLATGTWGGQHIRMEVEATAATIDYDCATGTITGPFKLDSRGHFSWHGRHVPEHGGPVRRDEDANGQPATYSGSVNGDTMTLIVRVGDRELDRYTLKRGSSGRVFKCK